MHAILSKGLQNDVLDRKKFYKSVLSAHKGKTGTDKSAQVLLRGTEQVPHPPLTGGRTLASGLQSSV